MSASTTERATAHAAVIAEIYRAFVRRDVPAILDRIAPDCRWELWADNRAQRAGVPTMQPRVGPAGVADFFSAVAQLEMHDFQVLDLLASERQVVAEVEIDYTTTARRRLRDQELHLWTLDEQQRVVGLRHYVDTAKHIAAFAAGAEASIGLARRFVLEHNQAEYRATFDAVLAPECTLHECVPGVPDPMDRAAYEQFIAAFRRALPDIRNTVDEVVADENRVVVRWTGRATHTGDALMGIPASGRSLTAHGVYVFRFASGRIVEVWDIWDSLKVLQQLQQLQPSPGS